MDNKALQGIHITGLAELAQTFQDDDWMEITIKIRKSGDGAEVIVLSTKSGNSLITQA